MTYYSIDDGDGANICSGIQLEHKARETAQRYADDAGEPVLLYSSDGSLEETIEPANKTAVETCGLHLGGIEGECRRCGY